MSIASKQSNSQGNESKSGVLQINPAFRVLEDDSLLEKIDLYLLSIGEHSHRRILTLVFFSNPLTSSLEFANLELNTGFLTRFYPELVDSTRVDFLHNILYTVCGDTPSEVVSEAFNLISPKIHHALGLRIRGIGEECAEEYRNALKSRIPSMSFFVTLEGFRY